MKAEILYRKGNNLSQSQPWLDFQKGYGRQGVKVGSFLGYELPLPLGKKALWLPKAPQTIKLIENELQELKSNYVFVRIEPAEIHKAEIKKYKLKKVDFSSVLSGQKSPQATWVLGLDKNEEEIMAQMKPKTRYNIRLAQRKGVTVKIENDSKILCRLLSATAQRQKNYAPHPDSYYKLMLQTLAPDGLVKNFVARNKAGQPIAAILVSLYGQVATYLHGGFSDQDRNLMAPFLCQMEAIKEARRTSCRYYDFWGVAETDDPDDPWAGITRFKQGFGGERLIFPGSYDYVNQIFWYNLFTLSAKLKRAIH